jgi:hypothetical protein
VIALELDRLFRSALDALTVVEDLRKRSVALHLLDLGGDISGKACRNCSWRSPPPSPRPNATASARRITQVKADQKRLAAATSKGVKAHHGRHAA